MIELRKIVIRQVSFTLSIESMVIEPRSYAVLMGPTACGKTTLVEAICGLRAIESGQVLIDGVDVTKLDAAQRGIGYVPQDRVIFPTMRVDRQIEYGLRLRRATASQRTQRVSELGELLGISDLLNRFPRGLSGGEQQRVALARALAFRPKLICLDEPLSALDQESRQRMAKLLKEIHERERVTIFHITHNADDAIALGTQHFQFEGRGIIEKKHPISKGRTPSKRNLKQ